MSEIQIGVVKDVQVCGRKCLISKIGVVLKRESEFSMAKVRRGFHAMIQPLEEVSEWEQSLVECKHDFGV